MCRRSMDNELCCDHRSERAASDFLKSQLQLTSSQSIVGIEGKKIGSGLGLLTLEGDSDSLLTGTAKGLTGEMMELQERRDEIHR